MVAKQIFMAHQPKASTADTQTPIHEWGFPAERVTAMLRRLKPLLTLRAGRPIETADLGALTGRSARTIEHWLEGEPLQQVQFLLSLVERLPVPLQHEWWQTGLRLQPTLQHPRLAHDPLIIRHLEELIAQPHGLTVIQGETAFQRAFLLMALGNSAWWQGGRAVTGIDRHDLADWATPPHVQCLPRKLEYHFQQLWSAFHPAPASLVLLGGLGLALTSPALVRWAQTSHVLVTDAFAKPQRPPVPQLPVPIHWLTVTAMREQPAGLRVTITAG
jgi:hypothetical protein